MEQDSILPKEQFWWDEEEDVSLLPSSLFSFLRYLRGFLVKYDQWLLQPHDIVVNRVGRMEDDIHKIRGYCEGLNSKLGRPICIQGTEFPDIRCAIEFLASAIAESNGLDAISLDLPALAKQVGELYDSVQVVTLLKEQFTRIEQDIAKYDGRFTFIQPILLSVSDLSNQVHSALARIMTLKLCPQVMRQNLPSDTWTHNFAPMPDQAPPVSAAVPSLGNDADARIRNLEHIVKSLEKRIVGDGIRVGHFLFQSKEDLRIWMATNVTNNHFGLFLDAISIFDFLAQPHTDTETNMNHLYASQKNGFETTYESHILSSMQNLFPNLFGKSSSDGMDTSQSLPGLPSIDKWNCNGVTGLQLPVTGGAGAPQCRYAIPQCNRGYF